MTLADMLKIINPTDSTIMDKEEFIRRLRVKHHNLFKIEFLFIYTVYFLP